MSLYGAELAKHLSAHHNTVSSDVRYGRIFFSFVILDCIGSHLRVQIGKMVFDKLKILSGIGHPGL